MSSSIVTTSAPPRPSRLSDRSSMRASSVASPRDGSSATVRISRPEMPAAVSTCCTTDWICSCCVGVARITRLLALVFTVTTGAAAPEGSFANICEMVCEISEASALRSVMTRTSGVPPTDSGAASSLLTIWSAISRTLGGPLMITALRRVSAATRTGARSRPRRMYSWRSCCGMSRRLIMARSERSFSTSGAMVSARACFSITDFTCAVSAVPFLSSGSMSFSTASRSGAMPVRISAFEPVAGTMETFIGSCVAGLGIAAAACCRAGASWLASAKVSGCTRTCCVSAPATAGAASSCCTSWSATAMRLSGALTMSVPVRRSLVTSTRPSPPGSSRRARVASTCLRSALTWSVRPLLRT